MAEPFLSEIRMMSFNFAPKGWAQCNGQLMPINQNQALFALLGTRFGGNGQTTFALPNLQGRTPIHVGSGFTLGQAAGEQAHTLSIAEMPTHTHFVNVNNGGSGSTTPLGNVLAKAGANVFGPAQSLAAMNAATTTATGGSQAHLNMMPFLTISFCIALQGIFPSPN
jgi:microcystin-dependent protein